MTDQPLPELCPNCVRRDVDPGSSYGWCAECSAERKRHLASVRQWRKRKKEKERRQRRQGGGE